MNGKGFLFDLDGTLVSSLAVVERAWLTLAAKYALNPKEVLDFIHGKQAITSLRHFMAGYSDEDIQKEFKALEHQETIDTDGIVALPGAVLLLNRLNELGIPGLLLLQARSLLLKRAVGRRGYLSRRYL